MQQKEQYKLPEAFGYLSCAAFALSNKVAVFHHITVAVLPNILFQ